jgi:hypothetical protein
MILDATDGKTYTGYTILDALTGRCLDDQYIFYADSDRGFYKRYLVDDKNRAWFWDRRTRQKADGDTPDQFKEVAWELVRRPIAIFKKATDEEDTQELIADPKF